MKHDKEMDRMMKKMPKSGAMKKLQSEATHAAEHSGKALKALKSMKHKPAKTPKH